MSCVIPQFLGNFTILKIEISNNKNVFMMSFVIRKYIVALFPELHIYLRKGHAAFSGKNEMFVFKNNTK